MLHVNYTRTVASIEGGRQRLQQRKADTKEQLSQSVDRETCARDELYATSY